MIDTAAEIGAPKIPVELTSTDQWVLWKTVIRNGKPTKVPYQADGVEAASNNPESWGLFPDVLERYGAGGFDGIGFMFGAERSGFVGIDLDGCRDPETGIVQPWAKEIIERLDTYSEVSPSRTGVKLFLRGRSPFETGKNLKLKNVPAIGGKTAGIEIYDRLRYFAVTGWRLNGPATCEERQAELDWLKGKYWGDVLPIQNGDFYGEDSVLERARKYLAKCPPAIEGQNGSAAAFHVACVLVLGFGLSRESALVLFREWNQICQPPWNEKELAHKIDDAAKQSGTRNYLRNVAPQNWQTVNVPSYREPATNGRAEAPPIEFPWLTSAELSDYDEEIAYLIDDVWPEEQGGIISGRFKTLKTGFAIGMATAGSMGADFLGRFRVAQSFRCGIMSAESGMKSLRERGKAIAASMGVELSECCNLLWSTASPRLARIDHLDALRKTIVANGLRGLIVDPTYLALCDVGADSTNVFKMGAVLNPLTEIIRETRCSIVLVNHNIKGRSKDLARFDPPDLAEVSMSGFMEWARFWCLLGQRQEWDEEAGQHWLWLRTGGSAGHAGLWHLDVTEGKRSDPGGRRWESSIVRASEGNRNIQAAEKAERATIEQKQREDDKREILQGFGAYPDGQSKRCVRDSLAMGDKRFNPAFAELCRDGLLILTTIKKANRGFEGYRIKRDSED